MARTRFYDVGPANERDLLRERLRSEYPEGFQVPANRESDPNRRRSSHEFTSGNQFDGEFDPLAKDSPNYNPPPGMMRANSSYGGRGQESYTRNRNRSHETPNESWSREDNQYESSNRQFRPQQQMNATPIEEGGLDGEYSHDRRRGNRSESSEERSEAATLREHGGKARDGRRNNIPPQLRNGPQEFNRGNREQNRGGYSDRHSNRLSSSRYRD